MDIVSTTDAPAPGGHYSQAVVVGGLVFVSGQLPFGLDGKVPNGIAAQARQCLANVEAILKAAGSGLDRVVSATLYVTDIGLWPAVNAVYADVFGAHVPARTVAVSPQLHHGALIEVQVVASL